MSFWPEELGKWLLGARDYGGNPSKERAIEEESSVFETRTNLGLASKLHIYITGPKR